MRQHFQQSFKQAATLIVGLCFVFSSIACCCLAAKAHADASVKQEKNLPSCHKQESSPKSETTKHKSCDCSLKKQGIDQTASSFVPALILNTFVKLQAVDSEVPHANAYSSLLRANTGPPVARYSIPVYLQISNLRL